MLLSYYRRPLFLFLLAYAGAILLFPGVFSPVPAGPGFPLPRAGVPVEGRVAAYPAKGPGGLRFPLETYSVYGRPLKVGLMVYAPAGSAVSYGDSVSFLADLGAPPGAAVPGALDWADYLARRGIAAQARARDLEVYAGPGAFLRLARGFRAAAIAAFERALPGEGAAVLAGVVLGEKRGVPEDLRAAFQDSGAMHLLVASGSNVGFVVAVVYFLAARLGLRRRPAGLAALLAAGFYVTAAGLDAPLVRAYLMFGAGLAAWLLRREAGAFHALTAAALLILLASPRSLYDAGFQMSFLAAYGLTVGVSLWGRRVPRGLPGAAAGLLLVSACAQLGLYPLLALYFHKISLVSLLSNMALVPAAGAAMALGFLLAALAWAGPVFTLLSGAAALFMKFFLGTVKFFAGLPFASVSVPEPSPLFTAGFFLFAFALLHAPLLGLRRPRFYAPACGGLLLMFAGQLWRASVPAAAPDAAVLFCDGNTYGALVRAGGGLYLLNPGFNGEDLAAAVLSRGSGALEGVLLTSLDELNYGGLEKLSRRVPVRRVLLPYGPRPAKLRRLLSELERSGTRVQAVWPGEEPGPPGISCGWEGRAPGYAGAGDEVFWRLGGVTLRAGGRAGELAAAGKSLKAEAVRGGLVPLGAL